MKLKNGAGDIVSAIKESKEVEANAEGTKIRRIGERPVPELTATAKKRDSKQ